MKIPGLILVLFALPGWAVRAEESSNWGQAKVAFDSAASPINPKLILDLNDAIFDGPCFTFGTQDSPVHLEYGNMILKRAPLKVRPIMIAGETAYVANGIDFTETHGVKFTAAVLEVEIRKMDETRLAFQIQDTTLYPHELNPLAVAAGSSYCVLTKSFPE